MVTYSNSYSYRNKTFLSYWCLFCYILTILLTNKTFTLALSDAVDEWEPVLLLCLPSILKLGLENSKSGESSSSLTSYTMENSKDWKHKTRNKLLISLMQVCNTFCGDSIPPYDHNFSS